MTEPRGQGGGPPGYASTPPGWYPDPDGAPGLVRWFDGAAWSDVTTPAGPGVAVAGAWEPRPAAVPPASWEAPPRDRTPLIVGISVLALVVVVVLAVVLGTSGNTPGGSRTADLPTAAPVTPPGTEFPPGTVRVIDQEAGISYPWLGNGWYEYDLGQQRELTSTAGQFFTTQEDTPAGTFIAQCTSGPLADGYGWAGPGTMQATVSTLADSVRNRYYPLPNEMTVSRDEALTVDGRPAHLQQFDLTWDVEGFEATGERAALLLIDTGRPAPALLYISIPNTHAELYGVIDRVLGDVDVL